MLDTDPEVAYADIRIYVDGENTASVQYKPAKAAGVGVGTIGELTGPGDPSDQSNIEVS